MASIKVKYLGIHLPTKVEDLYSENFKSLRKETEEDLRRWEDLPRTWGELILSKGSSY